MLHKTLQSYWDKEPYDPDHEHPDGPLWLMSIDELVDLPEGIPYESTDGRDFVRGKDDPDLEEITETKGKVHYGLRGR